MQKIPCEFCGKLCAVGGAYQSHVHFKHVGEVIERFSNQLLLQHFAYWYEIQPKLLCEVKQHGNGKS